jgi:hypothetical protein
MTDFIPNDLASIDYIAYEGFRGDMITDRVIYPFGMYLLKNPIIQKDISIYAMYSIMDENFRFYAATYGYKGFHNRGKYDFSADKSIEVLCTGDYEINYHMTIEEARESCKLVPEVMRTINAHSTASGFAGEDFKEFNIAVHELSDMNFNKFDKYFIPML